MILGGHERRPELEGVPGPQSMDAEQPHRRLADPRDGLNLPPCPCKPVEAPKCVDHRSPGQAAVALEPGKGRDARHLGRPPDDDLGVALVFAHHVLARRLDHERRHHRGAVPEPHRPDRRSWRTAETALAPGASGGAG